MKKFILSEMNEKYKNCPVRTNEYEIDGRKYIVRRHFIGEKDIDTVIQNIALRKAMNEMLESA